jgi:Rrf2 family protein
MGAAYDAKWWYDPIIRLMNGMSRSTKLAGASYILSYIAAKAPDQVTTDQIARAVKDHPARVRQIVAALVKANFLTSVRGASGGVTLARPASQINLKQVFEAVEDQPILALSLRESFDGWGTKCRVQPVISALYSDLEAQLLDRLGKVRLDQLIAK